MADLQQSGRLRSAQAAEQHGHDRARAGDELGLEQGQHRAHLQAAPGRQVARRQAVHRQGREVHLRPAAGQGAGQVPQEPAQGLVRERRRRHDQRRLRGDVPSQAAAAVAAGDARLRLYADVSLPRAGGADAHASDRHRPVQVRRVEAERVDQAREEPGLLEEGPALSRRHRVHDHHEPRDRGARLRRRQGRHDLPDRDDQGA